MSRRACSRPLVLLLLPLLAAPFAARASAPPGTLSQPAPGPQTIAAIPLDEAVSNGGLVMQAHAQVLRPAPLPNLDVSDPGLNADGIAAQSSPSLSPDVFNRQTHFSGDGYANGSSVDTDQLRHRSTGGGMSLSIPMQ